MEGDSHMQSYKQTLLQNILLLVVFSLFLSGCASKVAVDSVVDMPSKSGVSLKSVGIAKFSGDKYDVSSNALMAKVKSGLINQGHVQVNNNSPFTLHGEISPSKTESQQWREKHEGKDSTWYSYHVSVNKSLTVTYYVMSGNNTLTSGSETFNYNKEKSEEDYKKAKSKLPSDTQLANILVDQAAEYIVKQISPYRAQVKLNYLNGDDENLELGIEYVKKARLDQAFSIFDQIAQNSVSIEDQAKAIHNQGLILLMQKQHSKAYELMTKANLIDPRNMDILDSMKNVEDYKVLNDKHKRQIGI